MRGKLKASVLTANFLFIDPITDDISQLSLGILFNCGNSYIVKNHC